MDTPNDKTLGIVLTTIALNDHTQLVHLYTQTFGRITCRVPLVSRGRNASRLRNMMTPTMVLQMVLGGPSNKHIRTISEAQIVQSPYMLSMMHPDKTAQCIYIAELIEHTVREEEANSRLWDYLTGSLAVLENNDDRCANFHLIFTCGLIEHLGFSIDTEDYTPGSCFDLREGCFTNAPILHPYYLNAESASWFCKLFESRYDDMHLLSFNHDQRNALLGMLIAFLKQQIPEMGELRSIEILQSLSC